MLERLDCVKKVGLFYDYVHSPGCELGPMTLIYGENGVGKSTIAAILDSLRESSAGQILRRRTLPGDVAPTVDVRLNGKAYCFGADGWNDQPPYDTLDVFFPGFVSRNVHAATRVDPEHRRNLCELVLGREAVKNVTRLAEVDDEARNALKEIRQVEQQIQLLIKQPDTLETFIGLASNPGIDEEIDRARVELKQAQSKEAILARAVPEPVPLPTMDGSGIAKLLEKTAEGIGVHVADEIREHIREHLDSEGEKWLAYGAEHIRDNKCPFCAQDLGGSCIAKALRSYFSTAYRAYAESVSAEIQEVRDRSDSAVFTQVRAALVSQLAIAAQWTDEIAIDQRTTESALTEAQEAWSRGAENLLELVANKQAQPLEVIDATSAEEALAEYRHAIDSLAKVNDTLRTSRRKVDERRAALSKTDTAEIEERVHRLENQKARFEPPAEDLLKRRNSLLEKRQKLDKEKAALKQAIDGHAARVVGKYQDRINQYLAYFGCDIEIESVEPKFPSGKAIVHYKLKAHGHEIQLGFSEVEPCFDTVLSEGDRNTLALSFFFARLKDVQDLTGRVLVLDDPVNSLGRSRRSLVAGAIRDMRARGAQVVVLTHDERLAALIWRDKTLKDIVSLQVGRSRNGSQLRPWDVERSMQSEYVEHYLTLVDYLENDGDHKPAARCIRLYVEQRLRYLYPGPPFRTRDSLGQMIARIRQSAEGSRLHALHRKITELEAINQAALPSHHPSEDDPGLSPLTPDGVRLFAEKALTVLE